MISGSEESKKSAELARLRELEYQELQDAEIARLQKKHGVDPNITAVQESDKEMKAFWLAKGIDVTDLKERHGTD